MTKQRKINAGVAVLTALALCANTLLEGWNGMATAGNMLGYVLLVGGLWCVVDDYLKGSEQC